MDPITIGIAAVGLGLKLFGGMSASKDANQSAQISNQIAGVSAQNAQLEGQVVQQHRTAMELSARRSSLEMFRNTQQAQAMGLAAATSQNAQLGSGYLGGQATTLSQGLFNVQGVNQNLAIGENIFDNEYQQSQNNAQISRLKGQQASVQGQEATDQGWASLGGSLMGGASTIGNVAGAGASFFGRASNLFSSGSLSGGFGNT